LSQRTLDRFRDRTTILLIAQRRNFTIPKGCVEGPRHTQSLDAVNCVKRWAFHHFHQRLLKEINKLWTIFLDFLLGSNACVQMTQRIYEWTINLLCFSTICFLILVYIETTPALPDFEMKILNELGLSCGIVWGCIPGVVSTWPMAIINSLHCFLIHNGLGRNTPVVWPLLTDAMHHPRTKN